MMNKPNEYIRLRFKRGNMPHSGQIKIFDDLTGEQIIDVTSIVLHMGVDENAGFMKAMLNRRKVGRSDSIAIVTRIEVED